MGDRNGPKIIDIEQAQTASLRRIAVVTFRPGSNPTMGLGKNKSIHLKPALTFMPLEARMMFDGAAVADAANAVADATNHAVEVRPPDPAQCQGRKEVAFVDTSVTNYQALEQNIAPGVEVVEIQGRASGLAQMAEWAATHSGYDAIHVFSHGAKATLNLGSDTVTAASVDNAADELAAIGRALRNGGDLLLYGCDLAKGADGQAFLEAIRRESAVDVAASDDTTGAGGNWALERNAGTIETRALDPAGYDGALTTGTATITVNTTFDPSVRVMEAFGTYAQSFTGQNIAFSALNVPTGCELVAYNKNTASWDAVTEGQIFTNSGVYDRDDGVGLKVSYGLRGAFNSIGTVTATWRSTSGSDTTDYTMNIGLTSSQGVAITGIAAGSQGGTTQADQVTLGLGVSGENMAATGATPRPTFEGTAVAPLDNVIILIDGVAAGTTTADNTGHWTFTPSFDLSKGPHTVRAIDTSRNGAPYSADFQMLIDPAPEFSRPASLTYVEQQGAKQIFAEFSLSKGINYGGGDIAITYASVYESFSFAAVADATALGTVSVSGSDILVGTGSGTQVIGRVVAPSAMELTLAFNPSATVTDSMATALLRLIRYTNSDRNPPASLNLSLSVRDHWAAADFENIPLTITRINDAAEVQASTAQGNQKSAIVIPSAAWLYSDAENNSLTKIRIDSLPDNGVLKLNDVAVTQYQEITVADIAANKLTFTPTGYWVGSTSFQWNGFDGSDWSTSSATMTVTVNRTGQTPILTVSSGKAYTTMGSGVVVDPGLSLVDPNAGTAQANSLTTAYAAINSAQADDFLSVDNALATSLGITASWDGATAILTLGSAGNSAADYQALLRTVTLNSTSGTAERDVVFSLSAYNPQPTYTYSTPAGLNGGVVLGVDDLGTASTSDDITYIAWPTSIVALKSYAYPGPATARFSAIIGSSTDDGIWSSTDLVVNNSVENALATLFGINASGMKLNQFGATYMDLAVATGVGNDAVSFPMYASYPHKFAYVLSHLPADSTLSQALGGFSARLSNGHPYLEFWLAQSLPTSGTVSTLGSSLADAQTAFDMLMNQGLAGNRALTSLLAQYNVTLGAEFPTALTTDTSGWVYNTYAGDIPGPGAGRYGFITIGADGVIHSTGSFGQGVPLTPADVPANSYEVFGFKATPLATYMQTAAPALPTASDTQGWRPVMFSGSNTAPTVTALGKSGTEAQELSFAAADFTAHYSDTDSDSMNAVTISTLPDAAQGTLYLNGVAVTAGQSILAGDLAKLTFRPADAFSGTATFGWKASDGSTLSSEQTSTLTIAAINHAPALVDSRANTLTAIPEDVGTGAGNSGTTLANLIADGAIADVDVATAPKAVAVTSVDNTNGIWQYNTGSGWTDFSATTGQPVTLSHMRLLDETSLVRFVPNADYSGTATFGFRPWDKSSGSTGDSVDMSTAIGARAADVGSASITVTAGNDAPVLSVATTTLPVISEDNTAVSPRTVADIASTAMTDTDASALSGIAVTGFTNAATGTWRYSTDGGSTWHSLTAASDADALLLRSTDLLDFIPDGANGGTATLTWRAWDRSDSSAAGSRADISSPTARGGATAYSTGTGTTSVTVNAVNDAPTIQNATISLPARTEDDTGISSQTVGDFAATAIGDVDSSAVSGIAITGFTNAGTGTWRYSTDGGTSWTSVTAASDGNALLLRSTDLLDFIPDAANGGTATLTWRAWDRSDGMAAGSQADLSAASSRGGATAYSSATNTTSVTVSEVNDAPTLSSTTSILTTKSEDASGVSARTVGSFASAAISDVDNGAADGIAVTGITNAATGTWRYSTDGGATWTAITAASDADALVLRSTDLLDFIPDAANGGTATLTWRAWDRSNSSTAGSRVDVSPAESRGGTTAFSSAPHTTSILINSVNDAPTLIAGSCAGGLAGKTLAITGMNVGDVDHGDAVEELTLTATMGSLVLPGTNGLTVTAGALNSPSVTLRGTIADLNAALAGLALTTTESQFGSITVTATVNDLGNTGAGGAHSATGTVSFATIPVPKPPPPAPPPKADPPPLPVAMPLLPPMPLVTVVRSEASAASMFAALAPAGTAQLQQISLPAGRAASDSFPVSIIARTGGVDALTVNRPVTDAVIDGGDRFSVTLPNDAFAHTRQDVKISLVATRLNGAPLPGWMNFNPQTATFEGTPPPGFQGEVTVKVLARDSEGREAATTFKIVVGEAGLGRVAPGSGERDRGVSNRGGDKVRSVGKLSLNEQLRAMSAKGRIAQHAALFSGMTNNGSAALGKTA